MTPLLESLQARFDAMPLAAHGGADVAATRRDLLADALARGLPAPRTEQWKYTSLRAFERRRFEPATTPTTIDPTLLEAIPAPRLVFVNGAFDAGLSQIDGLADGLTVEPLSSAISRSDSAAEELLTRRFDAAADAFARFNVALASDGVMLRLAAEQCSHAPLHLVFVGAPLAADSAFALASRIALGERAELCLVEHHVAAGEHAHFANNRFELMLAAGARLTHVRLQNDAAAATQYCRTEATLADGARYHRVDLELGAALSRHELNVDLAGDGAELIANGVLLADGRRHLDTRLGIRHRIGNTSSTMLWRGLGAERGRAVFHGGITIDEGADGSAAELSNKNLLLSADAEIDTQPVLEIFADEVKAAHGATVGQLDPTSLFYLRSRGLPADEAQRLLTVAFCREPLSAIDDSALAALLAAQLDARLHAGGAL